MENNGLGIDNWDCPIYRIYTFERFKELVTTKTNGLVNPAKWDDPFENFFLKQNAITSDGELVSLAPLYDSWYGQCWTKHRDSDAMWRIYSPNKDGIRVATTIRKLFSSFYDVNDKFASLKFLIGTVEYVERSEIEKFLEHTSFIDLAHGGQPHKLARTLCIKRPEFSHESEVRLLFCDNDNHGKNKVAIFPFNPDAILDEVAIDPRLRPDQFEKMKNEIMSLGCTIPIIQSDLYQITPKIIKLD